MDIPGERSSHSQPTPRGGGIAIAVATVLASIGWGLYDTSVAPPFALLLLAALMAVLGAFDDFMNLGIRPRLVIQFMLALAGVFVCMRGLDYQAWNLMLLAGLAVFALMWLCNLYNFMDGINGIAACQAISVCLIMGIVLHQTNADAGLIKLLAIIGCACAGFLYWNFPTARIFMGDTGSLFLGFIFGLVAIKTGVESIEIAAAWLIAMAIFIVDASYTLVIRLLTGQKFYLPHRSHSYQKFAVKFNSHTKTTLLICVINIAWLFPLTLLMIHDFLHPFIALGLAYGPLILIAARLRAGTVN